MSDGIEPVDVHLARAKADLKRAAITIERLRAELERLMDGLYSVQRELGAAGMAHTTAGLLVARLCMRNYDDRIEELENMGVVAGAAAPARDPRTIGGARGSIPPHSHIITTEQLASGEVVLLTQGQIDAAWKSAWDEDSFDWRNAAERALEKFGILRCEECRGSGEVIEGGKLCGLLVECESCGGHGWIIMSVDVDKYGRFGT